MCAGGKGKQISHTVTFSGRTVSDTRGWDVSNHMWHVDHPESGYTAKEKKKKSPENKPFWHKFYPKLKAK